MPLRRKLSKFEENLDINLYVHDIVPQCRTVLMVAKELDLYFTIREINLDKQEHLTEEFLKMNPMHTIPVYEERGYILTDSHAIACFLIDDFTSGINSLYPKELSVRAQINQYLMFEAGTMFPAVKSIVLPLMLGQESTISEEKIAACKEVFSLLDKILQYKTWLVGHISYTVADICCVTMASSITVLMDMDLYPNVKAWIRRCERDIRSYKECNVPGLNKLHALIRSALSKS
ncbi:glutathione S-transferase 1-like [Bombus pyrosoma]|uniref:glutathione S-transferase 1-like n=1 Tax=Bombus pyrosoma TaxID=396416 RepID=UPI001CB99F9A|nr:glutathione S-transferase 1-like [Bombus pyrosoma]XP_043601445.1 glutathione S-transferase 1-like [Bombus pyrosoma]XP_043601456.1 glutathione S-transferase 1-like [Bombus pyrosoma]